MSYFIIIRGPAAVGKTKIAKKLANSLNGFYISYDDIMEENKLDIIKGKGITTENFIKANQLIIPIVRKRLSKNQIVVLDGCFYRKRQLTHLIKNLNTKFFVFSLKAPVSELLKRNKTRKNRLTEDSVKQVYKLVSKTKAGINVSASGKTISQTVSYILKHLPL